MLAAYIVIGKPFAPKADGSITVSVVDLDGTSLKEKTIEYRTGDTLPALIAAAFENVTMDNGMLMTIESLTTPEDWSSFICVYQNGEMASEGLETLPFKDGDTIGLVMTAFDAEAAW